MLEWYEHTWHGLEYETFYEGRFLESWIDPGLVPELSGLFSRYDPDEMVKTLRNTMEFFTKIAKITADRNHYPFPEEGTNSLTVWVEKNYLPKQA